MIYFNGKLSCSYLAAVNEDDYKTSIGRNLYFMKTQTNSDTKKKSFRECMKYFSIPEEEVWRLGVGMDLLRVRNGEYVLEEFTKEEINDLITFVCTT